MRALLPRSVACACAASLLLCTAPAAAERVFGAQVLDEAKKVGEGRYRSQRDLEKTLSFFRSVYDKQKGIVWSRLPSSSKVKGVHIANTTPRRTWDGINVYETSGKVMIYVLKAEREGGTKAASTPGASRSGRGGK